MTDRQRLSELVSWSFSPMPRWRVAARWVPAAVGALISVVSNYAGTISGPESFNPVIDPESTEPLGWARVTGKGAGMPTAYPAAQIVAIYLDRATITPGLHPVTLPLTLMQPSTANPVGVRWTSRKDVDTHWVIHLTGPGIDLTLHGSWLLLAHLGTLGHWPEPA